MKEKALLEIASVPIFGMSAQWISWRLGLPSILILLVFGILVGPVMGFLSPDKLLGEALGPFISLSVAIILFEGGLSLKMSDIKDTGKVVRNLCSYGAVITWAVAWAGAYFVLGLSMSISLLLGAVLIVTGPTVIIPLLNYVRPTKQVSSVLRWEGIVIDPIGAVMALMVLEIILQSGGVGIAFSTALGVILKTILAGSIFGLWGALSLMVVVRNQWAPEALQEAIALMILILAYTVSNVIQVESGLLTVTVMGIVLANQKLVSIKHIVTFKEHLSVLLLSCLFILLAARLQLDDLLAYLDMNSVIFLMILFFVARPLSVLASTFRSSMSMRERLFMSSMAPRGIVAAAVSSLFALKLEEHGVPQAEALVPLTFLVIIASVVWYSSVSVPVAKVLDVVQPRLNGFLIVGAQDWARAIAKFLQSFGLSIVMVDTNKSHVLAAKSEGFVAKHGSAFSKGIAQELDANGVGRVLALTSSDEVNMLASIEYGHQFGKANVFRLFPEDKHVAKQMVTGSHPQLLFGKGMTYTYLSTRLMAGGEIKSIELNHEDDFSEFMMDNPKAICLFAFNSKGKVVIFNDSKGVTFESCGGAGSTLIVLT